MKQYLRNSWVDPRLKVQESKIGGKGIFAAGDIKKGEKLMVWGGVLVENEKYRDEDFYPESVIPISDDMYIGRPITDSSITIDDFLNHSCDPSAWLVDEVTVVARRNIKKGEEITVDCATWDADQEWPFLDSGESCKCGSKLCRKLLTPKDWMIPELQKRYAGHFSPYIAKKIELLNKNENN